jgi:hypothetical protein
MTDWASSGGVKIKRAKKHVRDLEAEIKAFREPSPYLVVTDEDTKPGLILYRVRILRYPDASWGAIAGDALHNLRSALNILWRIAACDPGLPADERSPPFPFDTAKKFKTRLTELGGSTEPREKVLVQVLQQVKPYEGGNPLLELLVEANDMDKHRLLLPAYLSIADMVVKVGGRGPDDWMEQFPIYLGASWGKPICPVEDGAILWVNAGRDHPAHVNMDAQPALDIAFGEGKAIKGKPILDTLLQITGEVEGIAKKFLIAGLVL